MSCPCRPIAVSYYSPGTPTAKPLHLMFFMIRLWCSALLLFSSTSSLIHISPLQWHFPWILNFKLQAPIWPLTFPCITFFSTVLSLLNILYKILIYCYGLSPEESEFLIPHILKYCQFYTHTPTSPESGPLTLSIAFIQVQAIIAMVSLLVSLLLLLMPWSLFSTQKREKIPF